MDTYLTGIKETCVKMALVLLAFSITAVLAGHIDAVMSLLLGGAGSYGYFFLLASRIYRGANMPSSSAVRYMRAGSQMRLAYICAMTILGFKIPAIQVVPFFLGLFTYQLLVRINGIYTAVRGYLNPNP